MDSGPPMEPRPSRAVSCTSGEWSTTGRRTYRRRSNPLETILEFDRKMGPFKKHPWPWPLKGKMSQIWIFEPILPGLPFGSNSNMLITKLRGRAGPAIRFKLPVSLHRILPCSKIPTHNQRQTFCNGATKYLIADSELCGKLVLW